MALYLITHYPIIALAILTAFFLLANAISNEGKKVNASKPKPITGNRVKQPVENNVIKSRRYNF